MTEDLQCTCEICAAGGKPCACKDCTCTKCGCPTCNH